MFVRQKYNLPIVKMEHEYFPVKELPYEEQAQIDFGQYKMRIANGKRKMVSFFAMVLSRSRMKYICFWDKSYTSQDVCEAHEKAFAFYAGVPKIIVYNQDRTMVVDENIGDIILTSTFKQYTRSRSFKLHFCRKADPESKGKVEKVVGYAKNNFLYNRAYWDIETLNAEAFAWLARTANCLPHNLTKKTPKQEYPIEKEYFNPYTHIPIENKETKTYHVRKTNAIDYKSNFYSVPMETYKGTASRLLSKKKTVSLKFAPLIKGQSILTTNHKRDTSKSLD